MDADPNQREDVPFPLGGGGPRPPQHFGYAQPQHPAQPQQAAQAVAQFPNRLPPNGQYVQAQPQPQPVAQQVHYAPEQKSLEWEAAEIKQKLAVLRDGASTGLYDMAEYLIDVVNEYRGRFQQTTGQPLCFEDALSHLTSAVTIVS